MTSFSRLEIISRVFFSPLNISNGSTRWRYNLSSRFPRIPLRSCSTYCIIRYYFARKISQDRPNRCFTNIYKIVRIIEIQHRRLKKKFQKRREQRIKFYKEFFLPWADTHSGRCSKLAQTFWNEINLVESRGLWKRGWRGMEIAPRYVKRTPSAEKERRNFQKNSLLKIWQTGEKTFGSNTFVNASTGLIEFKISVWQRREKEVKRSADSRRREFIVVRGCIWVRDGAWNAARQTVGHFAHGRWGKWGVGVGEILPFR